MVGDDALGVAGGARGVADGNGVPLVRRSFEPRDRGMRGEERLVFMLAQPFAGAGILAVADVDDDGRPSVLVA